MHPRPGDPARTDQAPTCVPTASGFLHRLAGRLNGPLFHCCCDAQLGKDLEEWACCKSSWPQWAHRMFSSLCPCSSPVVPGTWHIFLLLASSMYSSLCTASFWTKSDCCNVLWECQPASQVSLQLPVRGRVEKALSLILPQTWGFSVVWMKQTAFFGGWCFPVLMADVRLSTTAYHQW